MRLVCKNFPHPLRNLTHGDTDANLHRLSVRFAFVGSLVGVAKRKRVMSLLGRARPV